MKKVSVSYDKKLQQLIENDKDFAKLPLIRYVWAVIGYIIELASTGIWQEFHKLPVFSAQNGTLFKPTKDEVDLLVHAYKGAGRIEAFVKPGTVDVCLGLDIMFLPKGQSGKPILIIHCAMEPSAIRKLEIKSDPSLVMALANFDEIFARLTGSLDFSANRKRRNRVLGHLDDLHIMTIGQLARVTDPDRLANKIRNFGGKSMEALSVALELHDLSVGKYLGEAPGPLEVAAIKCLPVEKLTRSFQEYCLVKHALEKTEFKLIADLFPRSRFEQAVSDERLVKVIAECFETQQIPWT